MAALNDGTWCDKCKVIVYRVMVLLRVYTNAVYLQLT